MRSVCQLTAGLRYYFYNAPVDMRKSFHGLEGLVVEQFGRYLIGDEVFVFLGKNGRTVKMLHREGRGITLYTRKLDKGRFHAPRILADGKSCQLDYTSFVLMMLGQKGRDEHYPVSCTQ
ncbi:IS66 family insertion sequence element accessory protein TnpB [Parabacteroides sp. ZJ-118]|uniref:IS66 family insertion sequence element accessory protein TnpB n=1 Tax=Parabacteroides sp. ZJ-118 TaxID=2709398 RepID=UPI0013EC2999|nr:IS66 family insertion sequence element accessory protein TnpB [Parabacteroides sp. ZJ-118]